MRCRVKVGTRVRRGMEPETMSSRDDLLYFHVAMDQFVWWKGGQADGGVHGRSRPDRLIFKWREKENSRERVHVRVIAV